MFEATQALFHLSYLKGCQWYQDPSHVHTIQRYKPSVPFWQQMYSLLFDPPTLIVDGIYLGNAMNASCQSILEEHKIDAILNISQELPNFYPASYTYLRVSVKDLPSGSLKTRFEECYQFIKRMQQANKRILIHCYAGASRSAAVTAYYLMREQHLSWQEAIDFLEQKRNIVNINLTFLKELKELRL